MTALRATLALALFSVATTVMAAAQAEANDFPLFKAYPELEARLPKIELTHGFTPVEELKGLERSIGFPPGYLWVKRDDRSWEPLGGNKTRKLEFLLGDAAGRKIDTLVTCGMYGSNHALTTALVAKQLGYKLKLILGPQPVTPIVKEKLLALHALGAELSYHSNRISMGLEMARYMVTSSWLRGHGTYWVPPGGSNVVGSVGYVDGFLELVEQVGLAGLPKEIVVPVGTGGTSAGLLVGSCLAGAWEKTTIYAIETVDRLLYNEHKLRKDSRALYDSIVAKLDPAHRAAVPRCDFEHSHKALVWDSQFYPPEYGAAGPAVDKAIALLKQTDGLVMDTTYSGKALAYYLDLARRRLTEGKPLSKILFWHTYNSYPLDGVVDSYPWSDPENRWKDLPKPFHRLFR